MRAFLCAAAAVPMRVLEYFWYRVRPGHLILYPLSLIFAAVAAMRRAAVSVGMAASEHMQVPVIVVGNITVGGTGKTPLVIWLAEFLRQQRLSPRHRHARLRRNARGSRRSAPTATRRTPATSRCCLRGASTFRSSPAADASMRRTRCCAAHPECDVLISDDGLQHYALARDHRDRRRGWRARVRQRLAAASRPAARAGRRLALGGRGGGQRRGDCPGCALRSIACAFEGETFVTCSTQRCAQRRPTGAIRPLHAVAGIGNPTALLRAAPAVGARASGAPVPDHFRFARR